MSLNDELKALRDRWRDMPPLLPGHHWDRYLPLRMADELEAILERYEGYVVVPREPTRGILCAMHDARNEAYIAWEDGLRGEASSPTLCEYRAMIEAAEQKP